MHRINVAYTEEDNDSDTVGTDLLLISSKRHIPLPPPSSHTPVKRGPRFKSMGGRRSFGAAVAGMNQSQPSPARNPAQGAGNRSGKKSVVLSTVHVLSDDD